MLLMVFLLENTVKAQSASERMRRKASRLAAFLVPHKVVL
jgi:hypothetical protein